MRTKIGLGWIWAGVLLLVFAFGLTVYNLYDSYRAAFVSRQTIVYLQQVMPEKQPLPIQLPEHPAQPVYSAPGGEVELPDYVLDPSREMPVLEYEGQSYIGRLTIPALALELPVISEWSYPALKAAPCRYSGSAYTDGLVIAGHNYKAHFADLAKLSEGDTITFTDVDGNRFSYQVSGKETLPPTAIAEMITDDWPLTLFTCTVGGSARVAVRCDRVE